VFGESIRVERLGILKRVGSLVEKPSLYPHLTGRENLEVIRRLRGLEKPEIERALKTVRMLKASDRLVKGYSTGMKQRLGLATALLGQPELLILDEPTNGLDPSGIHEMRDLLCRLPEEEGITVFLSSHILNEVEHIATQIGIIQQGRLIFQGTQDNLQSQLHEVVSLQVDLPEEAGKMLVESGWQVTRNGNRHLVVTANGSSDAAILNSQLMEAGIKVYHLSLERPSLEDIFLKLTEAG
jgi:ABC-2 type transport system ATP-binding protein